MPDTIIDIPPSPQAQQKINPPIIQERKLTTFRILFGIFIAFGMIFVVHDSIINPHGHLRQLLTQKPAGKPQAGDTGKTKYPFTLSAPIPKGTEFKLIARSTEKYTAAAWDVEITIKGMIDIDQSSLIRQSIRKNGIDHKSTLGQAIPGNPQAGDTGKTIRPSKTITIPAGTKFKLIKPIKDTDGNLTDAWKVEFTVKFPMDINKITGNQANK